MSRTKTLFLVCNAHLDLVWQWEWHESLAEALSTFRIAASFCETYDASFLIITKPSFTSGLRNTILNCFTKYRSWYRKANGILWEDGICSRTV